MPDRQTLAADLGKLDEYIQPQGTYKEPYRKQIWEGADSSLEIGYQTDWMRLVVRLI